MKSFFIYLLFIIFICPSLFAVPYSKILHTDENKIHFSIKDSFTIWEDAKQIGVNHCSKFNKYAFHVKRPVLLFPRTKLEKFYKKKGLLLRGHRVFEYICSNQNLTVAPSFAFNSGDKIVAKYSNYGSDIISNEVNLKKQSTDITFSIADKKKQCEAIGFKPMTEKFADCVLKLVELDVQTQNNNRIAAANNAGNELLANELKKKRQREKSNYLINLGMELMKPQSNNSFSRSTNCTITSFGNQSNVNCF